MMEKLRKFTPSKWERREYIKHKKERNIWSVAKLGRRK
jgi:hypothetical protein